MTSPLSPEALEHLQQVSSTLNQISAIGPEAVCGLLRRVRAYLAADIPGLEVEVYPYQSAEHHLGEDFCRAAEAVSGVRDGSTLLAAPVVARSLSRRERVVAAEEPYLSGALPGAEAPIRACWPILAAGELLGIAVVYRPDPETFSAAELLLLDTYASLIGIALSLEQHLAAGGQEQARRERELRQLRRAGMLISSRSSLKGTLETILEMALEMMDARYGIFRLVDSSGKYLVTQALAGENLNQPAVEALPIDENSITGLVAVRQEPLSIPDLSKPPWKDIYYPFDHDLVMRSELAVPLVGASGRLEGVLNLESPQPDAFNRQDRYILQIFATQAVIAIQEMRLLDALQALSELLLTQPLPAFHQALASRAEDLLNVSPCLIWLRDQDDLVLTAATQTDWLGRRIPLASSFIGRAIKSGAPVACTTGGNPYPPDVTDPGFSTSPAFAMGVPILSGETQTAIGVFSIYSASPDLQSQADWYRKTLSLLGHYAVLALQYHRHQEALRTVQEQKALAETFAAVGDISSNLLHSLNNKIGTIPVRVEGIQAKRSEMLASDPYLELNLSEIDRSASEAMEIVRENLFHLRPIEPIPIDISASVQAALDDLTIPIGIRIETAGLEGLPPVMAGQKRLAFVFVNLLQNAFEALGGRGLIRISGTRQGKYVELQVSDNGPGIDPTLHERIFEFDYSSHSARQPGKLGFGLWWVKTLIARFNGTISVESDGRLGTVFRFTLPIQGSTDGV